MRMPRSLQGRLLVLVLGLVIGVWVATVALTWLDVRHELDELFDSHLAQAAAWLVVQQAREIEDDDYAVDAPSLHRYAPRVAFQVFHQGRLALRSADAPALPMVEAGTFRTGFATVRIDDVAWRVFGAYGAERDVQVYVGEQVNSRAEILRAVLRSAFWPMLVALPLLALAVWWAIHRGMAPLRQLGHVLALRKPQAVHRVDVRGASSEMVPMLDALNGLFARIAVLLESERRFTADAAHELRTPIAAIWAQAQAALGATDDAERRHALQATLADCDRATRLVEQMLTLSRLDAVASQSTEPVELRALVREVVAELAPQALRKEQAIEVDAPAEAWVQGDATLMTVLVRNIVDNAIRYSPPRATVKVTLHAANAVVHLKIEDSGPGMSNEDLRCIGERFFRVQGSGQDGSGLGWSIVRRIASVLGAGVEVKRSRGLGGLAVRIDWPPSGCG